MKKEFDTMVGMSEDESEDEKLKINRYLQLTKLTNMTFLQY